MGVQKKKQIYCEYSTREINLVFRSTHVFFCLLYKLHVLCPEAMIGDCLKII